MSKARILIVEDKRVTAEHLRSALTAMGYEAESMVSVGEEAVAKAVELKPDLILMDIMLAGEMDGIEAAQMIRSRIDTPIVFLSAYSSQETVERAAAAEPFGYLLKPFRTEELRTTIETALFKHNTEKRLKQSEERLDLALKGGRLGTWEIDVKTGDAIFDERAAELLGYSLEDLEPSVKAWLALVHPDDLESFRDTLMAHLRKERSVFEFEHRIRHKTGEWRWCLARGQVVEFDEEGLALRMLGTNMDITRRKRAEISLSRRIGELEALNEMSREVNKSLILEEFVDACRKQIMLLLSPDLVVFYIREGDRLIYQDIGSESANVRFEPRRDKAVGECLCGLVASHGKPEYCLNIHTDPRCTLDECKHANLRSFAALPLHRKNEVVGVLGIASLDERDFSEETVFLEALAAHVSVGLHNASLHRRLERTVEERTTEIERRKRTEQSFRDEHAFREAVIKRAGEGLCVCHETEEYPFLNFTVWNDRMKEITGYSVKQINELGWYQSVYPDPKLREEAIERIEKMRQGEDLREEEWEVTRADGERRILLISSSVLETGSGQSHVLGLMSDVTDRKRVEDELKIYRDHLEELVAKRTAELEALNEELSKAKSEWELTFDSVPELIAIVDNDHRIQRGNKALADRLGVNTSELPGRFCYEAIHGASSPLPDCPHAQLVADGGNHKAELTIENLSGVFEVTVTPLSDSVGKPLGSVHLARDISEQQRTQEFRLQAERLGAIADMASGVAHHFNNMLQTIIGGVSVALMQLGLGKSSAVENTLKDVIDSCRFGAETVRRLQEFVRMGREQGDEIRALDLSKIALIAVEATRKQCQLETNERGIQVDLVRDLGEGCFVNGNESLLFEVITYLIRNALEAMPDGGELRIDTSVSADQVILTVKDSGSGIPPENLGGIFEPFFTTKGFQRVGMGLATSYGIVRRYGGTISAENDSGGGAIFKVKLPLAKAPPGDISSTEKTSPLVGLRILVIDDVEPIRFMLSECLNEFGHEVVSASSGEEGLRIFGEQSIDFVICDLGMPGMNGWEVGKRIKTRSEERGAAKVPFILFTGWGDQQYEKERLTDSGIDAVVTKPVEPSRLRTIVEELARASLPEG